MKMSQKVELVEFLFLFLTAITNRYLESRRLLFPLGMNMTLLVLKLSGSEVKHVRMPNDQNKKILI